MMRYRIEEYKGSFWVLITDALGDLVYQRCASQWEAEQVIKNLRGY